MFESNQTDRSPIVFLIRALSRPASQMPNAFAARKRTDGTEVIQRRMFIPAHRYVQIGLRTRTHSVCVLFKFLSAAARTNIHYANGNCKRKQNVTALFGDGRYAPMKTYNLVLYMKGTIRSSFSK